MILRHSKLFEGYVVYLGEDPIWASKGRPPSRRGGAYGGEPTVNLLRSFLNLGRAGDWVALLNRGLKTSWTHSPKEPVSYYRGHEMDFRSFMMQEINSEFKFLPEGSIDDNQGSPSLKSVNNEAPVIDAKPLTSLHPPDFVEDVADSDDASAGDNMNPLLGTSLPHLPKAGKKLRSLGKRKLPSGVGDSLPKVRKNGCPSKQGVHLLLLNDLLPSFIEFPSAKELKNSADFVLDNVLNSRTRELIYALYKATASYDVIRAKELKKDRAYAKLERKCNEALLDLNKNLLVVDMRTEIKTLQGRVDGLHSECTWLVLEEKKWINYDQTLSALQSKIEGLESERERLKLSEIQLFDEMGMLVARLVKASIIYGRCAAFEEVAKLKERFVMEKMAGYRPSSKQEYDQAGDDLANASYPFLFKYVNDPYASLEQLLSKKPESLRSKPSYVKAK
ncbi:hypothetical protein Tco_0706731 [Tanacetum coccineum]|uniref:Uncharacterized protein n=1 Tax=Tanacetum coccineum TaxID=301880 RepID=A0ABQ4Y8A4_9ASTR